jgi:hypothetical protein
VLKRDDVTEIVKIGAREVLDYLMLVRSADSKPAELLHAASALEDAPACGKALKASEAPQESVPKQEPGKNPFRTFWQKLFS